MGVKKFNLRVYSDAKTPRRLTWGWGVTQVDGERSDLACKYFVQTPLRLGADRFKPAPSSVSASLAGVVFESKPIIKKRVWRAVLKPFYHLLNRPHLSAIGKYDLNVDFALRVLVVGLPVERRGTCRVHSVVAGIPVLAPLFSVFWSRSLPGEVRSVHARS